MFYQDLLKLANFKVSLIIIKAIANSLLLLLMDKLFKEGFEKEKEQIKKAFEFGIADAYNFIEDDAEQYYNETYNQNK